MKSKDLGSRKSPGLTGARGRLVSDDRAGARNRAVDDLAGAAGDQRLRLRLDGVGQFDEAVVLDDGISRSQRRARFWCVDELREVAVRAGKRGRRGLGIAARVEVGIREADERVGPAVAR